MIALRRDHERHRVRHQGGEAWLTFARPGSAASDAFGALVRFEEDRLPPGASMPDVPPGDMEVLTYVREGALVRVQVAGSTTFIHPGEFHRASGPPRGRTKVARTQSAHLFRTWLSASTGVATTHPDRAGEEQRRFSAAERHGLLCVVASPDARHGSLRLHADAVVFSAILETGQHLVHELVHGRSAWLHIIRGSVGLADVELRAGDGAGLAGERSVSFTARDPAEILLLDLGERVPSASSTGGVP